MSEKPHQATPASVPGAVRVAEVQEPDAIEPDQFVGTSRRAPAARPPASRPPPVARPSHADDMAAKSYGRRTRAAAPGVISVSLAEPKLEGPESAPAHHPAYGGGGQGRGTPESGNETAPPVPRRRSADKVRPLVPATVPGAVRMSEVAPPPPRGPGGKIKPAAPATIPGVVRVDEAEASEPEQLAMTTRSVNPNPGLVVPPVDARTMRKGRNTGATTPGAVKVDSNDEGQPEAVRVGTTTTTTVAAYGMSKPARLEIGTATVPGAVTVTNTVSPPTMMVQESAEVTTFSNDYNDEYERKLGESTEVPGAHPATGTRGDGKRRGSDGLPGAVVSQRGPMSFDDKVDPNAPKDEYMMRMDAKVRQMERDLGLSEEPDPAAADGPEQTGTYVWNEDPKKDVEEPDEPPVYVVQEPEEPPVFPTTPAVTTADHGVAGVPPVEYGTTMGGGIIGAGMLGDGYGFIPPEDENLAVATPVQEEDGDLFLPSAVEYDPDAKPPLHKNRRFRLYFGAGVLLLIAVCVGVGVGIGTQGSGAPPLATFPPSFAPSGAPTPERQADYFRNLMAVVGDEIFEEGTSANLAADWIVYTDPRRLLPNDVGLTQRFLTALLWFETTNNGERPWRSCNRPMDGESDSCEYLRFTRQNDDSIVYVPENATRWLSGEHECDWIGIFCDDLEVTRALEIWGQNITGQLPTSIVRFPYLQSISLPFNEFTGTVPVEYAEMRHLLNLELHYNVLTGSISPRFWDFSALQNFNVGGNMLTGSIGAEVGQLTDLKGLHIFENVLTGILPSEIGELEFLSFTRFDNNGFNGTLPTEMGRLSLLGEIWGHENFFTGSIPVELGGLTELTDFRLHGNELVGTIPESVYDFVALTRLDLHTNNLDGTLSTRLGQLQQLERLLLSRNSLTGTIPTQIASLPALRQVWLHLNLFVGSVPEQICSNVGPGFIEVLNADCGPDGNPFQECLCCTGCCDRASGVCLRRADG